MFQFNCHYQSNQQFRLRPVWGGWYRLVARVSGMCLDVARASKSDAANVYQWSCRNVWNQEWFLIPR